MHDELHSTSADILELCVAQADRYQQNRLLWRVDNTHADVNDNDSSEEITLSIPYPFQVRQTNVNAFRKSKLYVAIDNLSARVWNPTLKNNTTVHWQLPGYWQLLGYQHQLHAKSQSLCVSNWVN